MRYGFAYATDREIFDCKPIYRACDHFFIAFVADIIHVGAWQRYIYISTRKYLHYRSL
jgi:hypothetical protein